MVACRNPECVNGRMPGVIAGGRGSAKAPLVGTVMRWGWVNCRACSPKDKDPAYLHVERSPEEIKERQRLADARANYEPKAVTQPLQRIRLNAPAQSVNGSSPSASSSPPDNAKLDKMLATIEKLTDQVAQLLEENRQLRTAATEPKPVKKPRVKKEIAAETKPS